MAIKSKPAGRRPAKARKEAAQERQAVTFAGLLKPLIPAPARPVAQAALQSAPLAHLVYSEELRVKAQGLTLFWQHFKLAGRPEPLLPSPKARGYRTTSKRKAELRGSSLRLLMGGGLQKKPFLESQLEPRSHSRIYKFLQEKLSEPAFRLVAGHLNYLIIRGSYEEQAVIFNVDTVNGPLVRKLKLVAEHLRKLPAPPLAAFVYPDPTGSDYYLEARRPDDLIHFKKLYGPGQLVVRHGGLRYFFHPTSFSQVNEAMAGVMLEQARELLAPQAEQRLIDLYCGYGLFSCFLGGGYGQVIGIDSEGPSIQSAAGNARHNGLQGRVRFLAHRISGDYLDEALPASPAPEVILLDPPRQGPQPGVIEALAARQPQKVLHVFCGVDQIPASLKEWQANGYRVERIVPLDMFPGTANLEILVLLTPAPPSNADEGGGRNAWTEPA